MNVLLHKEFDSAGNVDHVGDFRHTSLVLKYRDDNAGAI